MNEAKTNCEQAWQDAVAQARKTLGEDDYEFVKEYDDPQKLNDALQQLHHQYSSGFVPQLLKRLQPQLYGLRTFSLVILMSVSSANVSQACVWGTLALLLELACQSEQALNEITTMLAEISQNLELFEIYAETIKVKPEILTSLFDILIDVVLCSVAAIKHFRKTGDQNVTGLPGWGRVTSKFQETLKKCVNRITHLKELVEAQNFHQLQIQFQETHAEVLKGLAELRTAPTPRPADADITLPCRTLPFQRNPKFHGRTAFLDTIAKALQTDNQGSDIRSIALWGTGGIGKSQIALEYAHSQVSADVPIVLWVACEKEAEIYKSFDQAAANLNLTGYSTNNPPDHARKLVLQFLGRTKHPWLVVYDNVEDNDLLQNNWPKSGNGSIVVTCRSEIAAQSPAKESVEILTFSNDEGAELILNILGKSRPSPKEVTLSQELCSRLGGLALALDLMAKQMQVRKKPLELFLPYYEAHRRTLDKRNKKRGIHDPYYDKDLETVWSASFDHLSDEAATLMSLLCFTAPDAIPQSLFTGQHQLPPKYEFLEDEMSFDDTVAELVDSSLISVNSDTSVMSIHRLIQAAFWDRVEHDDRREHFATALHLISAEFPSKNAAGHMYDRHHKCQPLAQHIIGFVDRYQEMRKDGFTERVENLTPVLLSAAWYLHEAALLTDSKKLLDVAFLNCHDKDSIEFAQISDGAGALACEFAHYHTAEEHFKNFLRNQELHLPGGSIEISFAQSALAFILPGAWKVDEAIDMAEKSTKFLKEDVTIDPAKCHPDRLLRNTARAWLCKGEIDTAEKYFQDAEKWATKIFGDDSHYHGETYYSYGRIAAMRGNFGEAKKWYDNAYRLMVRVNPRAPAIAATLYQQGQLALQQGNCQTALSYFSQALDICEENGVKGNIGETARVLWAQSRTEHRLGLEDDGERHLAAALKIRDSLYSSGLFAEPPDKTEENIWDGLVGIMYR